jgi:hypothetical protein
MAFELDVLDGSLKPRHGVKLFDGRLKDAFLLDDIAAGQLDQLAVLDRDSKVSTPAEYLARASRKSS